MASGWQLRELISALRAESGRSPNVALGLNERDVLVARLQVTQNLLATQYDWPTLQAERDVTLVPGVRYYSFPAELPFEGVQSIKVRAAVRESWTPVVFPIEDHHFSSTDSDAGDTAWPPRRWRIVNDQLDVWPIPSRAGTLRLVGKRKLRPLIQDDDLCDLDGNLLVLYAAADLLSRQGAEDAQLVLARGQKLLRSILVRQDSDKSRPFVIGGGPDTGPRGLASVTHIRAPR